jgi:hypothetical protein
MMSAARSISLFAVVTSLIAGCERAPYEPTDLQPAPQFSGGAERTVYEALYDLTDSHFIFACSPEGDVLPIDQGEEVRIEGKIFERVVFTVNGAGGYHFTYHTMPVGLRGTGLTSGEEFRVIERDHGVGNQRLEANGGQYKQLFKMIGRDTGRTFWMVFSGNYRISADGEVTRTRDKETVQCKA